MQERMITKKTNPPFPGLSFCRAASNAACPTAQRYAAALQPNSTSHPFILDQKLLPTTVTTLRQLTEYYFHPRMGHTQGKVITKCCLIYYDSTNGIFFNFFFFSKLCCLEMQSMPSGYLLALDIILRGFVHFAVKYKTL